MFVYQPKATARNLVWFPLFLILYSFTGNVSNDIYMPSMPALAHFFGTTESKIQLTLTLWFLGTAIPQLLFGPVADRYGRRPLLFWGGMTFLVATLFCGFSKNLLVLMMARFFQGVGVCSLTIVSFAIIRELYHDNRCVRLLSLLNMCNAMAPLLGPLIGGYVFVWFGWRVNFYLVFVLALVGLIGLWYLMPESQLELNKLALKPRYLLKCYLGFIKNKFFLKHALVYGLLFGGMIAYLTGAPFILIDTLKIEPQHFGYIQLVIFGVFVLGASIVGRLVDRYGSKTLIGAGVSIILVSGIGMILSSLLFQIDLYTFVIGMMFYGLGFGLVSGPLAKETLSVGEAGGGISAALLGLSMTGFGSLGSFLVSLIYNGSLLSVVEVIGVMSLLAFLIYFHLTNKNRGIN